MGISLLSGKQLHAHAAPLADFNPHEILKRLRAEEFPCFLDSVAGPKDLAKHSILAWDPWAVLVCEGGKSSLRLRDGESIPLPDSPLEAMRGVLSKLHVAPDSPKPFSFSGGAIGWLSYDLGRWIEKLPPTPVDDLRFPELYLAFFDRVIVWEAGRPETAQLLSWSQDSGSKDDAHESTESANKRVMERKPATGSLELRGALSADHDRRSYTEAVRRAKEWILDGDIYQVNLSQRFEARIQGPSWALYERLRRENPAPYAAFLSTPWGDALSSSPELFLRIRGRQIETRPIKGTRPRCGDAARDALARESLLASEKDRAELTMIVDLERNDLKRVCETGSVEVPRLCGLEEYETVFHLVATIQGRLRREVDFADCLRAAFPGGSITGAPKIRAMEIISQLERSARSLYTGSIGWIGYDGDAEWNIAIRTLLRQGEKVCYRVGGGIVADSDPDAEYEETLHKGRGLARALGAIAERFAKGGA